MLSKTNPRGVTLSPREELFLRFQGVLESISHFESLLGTFFTKILGHIGHFVDLPVLVCVSG